MRSVVEPDTVRLARAGLLIAAAAALQVVEMTLPSPTPWFRLGLANAVVLVALERCGVREGVWVAVGKVLLGGLLTGRFLSPGFLLAASGTTAAVGTMVLALRWRTPALGYVGVSALGAEAHAVAQIAVAGGLLGTPAVWSLLPLVGTLAVVSGCITGYAAAGVAGAFPPLSEPVSD